MGADPQIHDAPAEHHKRHHERARALEYLLAEARVAADKWRTDALEGVDGQGMFPFPWEES